MLGGGAIFITALGKSFLEFFFLELLQLLRWEERVRKESDVQPEWSLVGLEEFIIRVLSDLDLRLVKRK